MSKSPINRSRRSFFAGTATVGAAALGAVVIPGVKADAAPTEPPAPEAGGGYRLSEHVKRYYKTTLV